MTRLLVALVALALALPAVALARTPPTNAPPGNSAIDEYLETVPGAAGNTPSRPRRQSGGHSEPTPSAVAKTSPRPPAQSGGDGALTPARRAQLERLGPDGKTLANAVDDTSPTPSNRSKVEMAVPKSDGRSPLGPVIGTFTGSDGGSGMGLVLPAILIAALLVVVLIVLLRRRAAS